MAGVGKKKDLFWTNIKKDFDVMKATAMTQGEDDIPSDARLLNALKQKFKLFSNSRRKWRQQRKLLSKGFGELQ